MSEYSPRPNRDNLDIDKASKKPNIGNRIVIAATAALALVVAVDLHSDYKDEAIRRVPPEGSVCTVVESLGELQQDTDKWFEGAEDLVLGKANILSVARRSSNTSDGYIQDQDAVPDYAICDYPGDSYADGGRRSVVNPDNVDPSRVTVVPESEFPESESVS
jgi:hypothetical protein